MGFNRRKMEDRRRQAAEQDAAARRATEKQILEDAGHLVAVWNERQAKRMPMLFSPTIGAAIAAGYWFLWARCPACRTTGAVDLRSLDWHPGAAVTAQGLIKTLVQHQSIGEGGEVVMKGDVTDAVIRALPLLKYA